VDKRKKIYKTIEKHGQVVEFSTLKPADIRRWLDKQARLEGKKIESGAVDALLTRAGRDLTALHSQMEKLIDHAGEDSVITLDAVKALTAAPLEESVFNVIDAIGEKNPWKAVSGLHDLLLGNENPQMILSMAARQFRLLLQVKDALAGGCSFSELAGATGIHPFVAKKIHQQSKGFDAGQLIQAIHKLHKIDEDVKGGRLDFTAAMEMFIVETAVSK
jgi:DNA polymerase-3 subunit delta